MDSAQSGSEPEPQDRPSQGSSAGLMVVPSDETSMQGSTKSMLTLSAGPHFELNSVKQLADIYPSSVQHSWRRLERLGKKFRDTFATGVSHLIRVPSQLKIPNDNSDLRLHDYGVINLEADIVVAIGYKENSRDLSVASTEKAKYPLVKFTKFTSRSKFESLTYEDKNSYRNLVVCAIKICLSLGVEVMFNGTCVLFDSTIPTGQKLGTTNSILVGLILAFMINPKKLQEEGRARLPVFPDRLIERALSKLEKIQDDTNFHREDLEFSLSAYFYGQAGSVSFRNKQPAEVVPTPAEDPLNQSQDTTQVSKSQIVNKSFLDEVSVIYMESVAGSSKSKENIQKTNSDKLCADQYHEPNESYLSQITFYRLFLAALGVREYTKSANLDSLMKQLKLNNEELLTQLHVLFEDKSYYKSDIERTMNLDLISLMGDIPFSSQVVENIFTLNPFA